MTPSSFQARRREKLRANKATPPNDGASTHHNAGIKRKLGARKDIVKKLGLPMPHQRPGLLQKLGSKKATHMSGREKEHSERFDLPSLAELRRMPSDDLIRSIQDGCSSIRARTHDALRRELARNFQRAHLLAMDEDAYFGFRSNPIWAGFRNGPKAENQAEVLRYVLRLARGFNGRRATDWVSKWFNNLSPLWDAKVTPEEAADSIINKKKLGSSTTPKNPQRAKKPRDYLTIRIPMAKGGDGLSKIPLGKRFGVRLEFIATRDQVREAKVVKLLRKPGHPLKA